MKMRGSSLVAGLLLAAVTLAVVEGHPCPEEPRCDCKWISGKKKADCTGAGLTEIPTKLDPSTKILVLKGNPLKVLPKDVFRSAELSSLLSLDLKDCQLQEVEDEAFRGMSILRDLDLSSNNLTRINRRMFDNNQNLQHLSFAHNPIGKLEEYQFPPLTNLKKLDLSFCQLTSVDRRAFQKLGNSVSTIKLNNNKLKGIEQETFLPLHLVTEVQTHDNPWVCNCDLKNFRDWLMDKKIYGGNGAPSTTCSEPDNHRGKLWEQLTPAQFACRPSILVPREVVFGAAGLNLTLACLVKGSPVPKARWINEEGIVISANNQPYEGQELVIREENIDQYGYKRWYNLTITDAQSHNVGNYKCNAENSGGLIERKVIVSFDDPSSITRYTSGGGSPGDHYPDHLSVVILWGSIAAAVLFIIIMILVVIYCWCKRRRRLKDNNQQIKSRKPSEVDNATVGGGQESLLYGPNVTATTLGGVSSHHHHQHIPEYQGLLPDPSEEAESQSLLLPMHVQHLMSYNMPDDPVELRDLRANSVPPGSNMTTPRPQTSSSGGEGSVHGGGGGGSYYSASTAEKVSPQPPDLSSLNKKTSTPMMHQNFPANGIPYRSGGGPAAPSPVPSTISSVFTNNSSFRRVGTLPMHFNRNCQTLGRVPVCAPSPGAASLNIVGLPPVQHHYQTLGRPGSSQQQQGGGGGLPARPGYVTLPRRPKASLHKIVTAGDRQPVYDGVGPRTSADGSSSLNLNKTLPRGGGVKKTSAPPVLDPNRSGVSPTDYRLGYESIQEEGTAAAAVTTASSPNILDLNGEPQLSRQLGTAEDAAEELEDNSVNSHNTTHNYSEAGSEQTMLEDLSGYCEPFGTALPPSPAASKRRDSLSSEAAAAAAAEPKPSRTLPRKPTLQKNGVAGGAGGAAGSSVKTGFRGIPAPKPRQRLAPGQVRKQFQDEGEDGSEV